MYATIADLLGKVFTDVVVNNDDQSIDFKLADGSSYMMYHRQDCCESVYIEDICGDIKDLVGTEILLAEESTSDRKLIGLKNVTNPGDESATWTFYRFRTIKGSVDIRWCGTSNGYYSESVDIDFNESKETV